MLKNLMLSLFALSLFALVGCGANQQVPVDDGIRADDLAVTTTSTLYTLGTINTSQAKSAYSAEVVAETALNVWNTAVTTNNSAQIGPATLAALNDLVNLQLALAAIQPPAGKAGVAVKAQVTQVNTTITQIEDVLVTLLVIDPGVQNLVTEIQTTTSVTPAQVTADQLQLTNDLSALATLLNPPASQP
jgi:hypothetical protein